MQGRGFFPPPAYPQNQAMGYQQPLGQYGGIGPQMGMQGPPQMAPMPGQQPKYIPQYHGSVPPGVAQPLVVMQQSPYPPPPVVISHPAPSKERYAWTPRSERMKWPVAESIDIEQIVRRGDLNSVMFYMDQFVNANITKEDVQHFGSKGALNAFLVMQLAVDYLLNQKQRLEAEIAAQQPVSAQVDAQHIEKYNQMVECATKEINARDAQIAEYKKKFEQMHEERRKAKVLMEKYRRKFKEMKGGAKKASKQIIEDSEPGALHDETAYRELKLLQKEAASKKSPVKSKKKEMSDDSESKSEGEIDTRTISPQSESEGYEYSDSFDGHVSDKGSDDSDGYDDEDAY